jgi:hypothetical protein
MKNRLAKDHRILNAASGQEDSWDLEKRDQKDSLNPNPDDDPTKKGKVD